MIVKTIYPRLGGIDIENSISIPMHILDNVGPEPEGYEPELVLGFDKRRGTSINIPIVELDGKSAITSVEEPDNYRFGTLARQAIYRASVGDVAGKGVSILPETSTTSDDPRLLLLVSVKPLVTMTVPEIRIENGGKLIESVSMRPDIREPESVGSIDALLILGVGGVLIVKIYGMRDAVTEYRLVWNGEVLSHLVSYKKPETPLAVTYW